MEMMTESGKDIGSGVQNSEIIVISVLRDNNENMFFKIKNGKGIEVIDRNKLITKDPTALIVFYERHMKLQPSK